MPISLIPIESLHVHRGRVRTIQNERLKKNLLSPKQKDPLDVGTHEHTHVSKKKKNHLISFGGAPSS